MRTGNLARGSCLQLGVNLTWVGLAGTMCLCSAAGKVQNAVGGLKDAVRGK